MAELCADAHAPIWLPRGRLAKYASDSAGSVRATSPSTRTCRLTAAQWTPPSCVAQELGVRLLLNQATAVADLAGLTLPPDWPDTLAELLLEDIDHEYLYDPALDGFEDDPDFGPPGMTSMRVQDWFTHFPGHPPQRPAEQRTADEQPRTFALRAPA